MLLQFFFIQFVENNYMLYSLVEIMNIIPLSIPSSSDSDHWEPGFKESLLIIILLTSYWSGLLAKL